MAGYSKTPLFRKLGIKPGFRVFVKNSLANYNELISPLSNEIKIMQRLSKDLDMIHFFTKSRHELESNIDPMMSKIKSNGMIWISWPKKSSKVETDISEDVIRSVILPLGLVDIKVCAIDEIWSGLKVVIRRENR